MASSAIDIMVSYLITQPSFVFCSAVSTCVVSLTTLPFSFKSEFAWCPEWSFNVHQGYVNFPEQNPH